MTSLDPQPCSHVPLVTIKLHTQGSRKGQERFSVLPTGGASALQRCACCRSEREFVSHTDEVRAPNAQIPSVRDLNPGSTECCGTETANQLSGADARAAADQGNESDTHRNFDTAHP